MKLRYEFIMPDGYCASSHTLYGDHDADVYRILNAMLRESIALARTVYKTDQVIVKIREMTLPGEY